MLQVRLQIWSISVSVFFLLIICSILIQSSQNTNNIKTQTMYSKEAIIIGNVELVDFNIIF